MELSTAGLEIAVFALATCATPGPVNIVATISGAQNGLKANLPFIFGATLSLSFVIIVSRFGVSQILETNELLARAVTLTGSAYILYLALLMFRKSIEISPPGDFRRATNFYRGARSFRSLILRPGWFQCPDWPSISTRTGNRFWPSTL